MAQRIASRFPQSLCLLATAFFMSAPNATAQTQQQYLYGSVSVSASTSEVDAYSKTGSTGALNALTLSPFADNLQGGALAIDGQGRFLFIVNPATSNISMFEIDQTSGSLTVVPGSPFSTPVSGTQPATSPNCLATENSGQFLYVGYQIGNIAGQGAVNEYLIDAANKQLVPLPGQPTTSIPSSPIGILTDPKGLHLYVGLGTDMSTGVRNAGTQVYAIDPVTGQLTLAGSAGDATFLGRTIALDPKGRFFFEGWGLGPAIIDSALISPADGTATTMVSRISLALDDFPAAMLAESSGNFLYVQQSSAPVAYSIDQTTGGLTANSAGLSVLNFGPGTAVADPLGSYLYSLQRDGIHGFLVDAATGSLSEISGSPFATGSGGQGMLTISGAPVQAASGPVAELFPPAANFGSITVGQTSNSQVVTLTNTGGQALAVNLLQLAGANPGDFVATPNCSLPTVLAPNATCSVSVTFVPSATGARQASLTASDDAPGSPQAIPLSGTGVAPQPAVTLMPGSLSFPSTSQGSTSASQSVTVTNSGSGTLHFSSVSLSGSNPGDFSIVNGCAGALAINATCTVAASFAPIAAGQRSAIIVVTDDAPDSPQSIQLSGSGVAGPSAKPAVTLSSNAINFLAVTQGTTAPSQNVTLTSSGAATLHISSVLLGGDNASDINLSSACEAGPYAVKATCVIDVGFSPVALGQRSASITITDDAPDSPQVITIGATVNPALTIAPSNSGGTTVTVSAGQTANFNFVLLAGAGFTGSATFTCSGAPTAASCTAPPVQLTSSGPLLYSVTVSTTGAATALTQLRWNNPDLIKVFLWRGLLVMALVAMALAFMFMWVCLNPLSWQHRRALRLSVFCKASCALLMIVTSMLTLCGAGCGSGGVSPANAQSTPTLVTPSGTTVISLTATVTAASGKQLPPQSAIQLTLVVN